MGNVQIDVHGVPVELRGKQDLIDTINEMTEDYTARLKSGRIKTNKARNAEKSTISFFGSIAHYLKGGAE